MTFSSPILRTHRRYCTDVFWEPLSHTLECFWSASGVMKQGLDRYHVHPTKLS